jgi:hypothetical protein
MVLIEGKVEVIKIDVEMDQTGRRERVKGERLGSRRVEQNSPSSWSSKKKW